MNENGGMIQNGFTRIPSKDVGVVNATPESATGAYYCRNYSLIAEKGRINKRNAVLSHAPIFYLGGMNEKL